MNEIYNKAVQADNGRAFQASAAVAVNAQSLIVVRRVDSMNSSDVTKLVKIPIRRMRTLTFKICRMRI